MPSSESAQTERRKALVGLLRSHQIRRQVELVEMLNQQGYPATQSSVSRDLRDLGVAKLKTGYQLPEAADRVNETELELLRDYVREISPAGPNLIVVATAVGAAQRVALTLDRTQWPDIVGTLSGDDTIFVATSGPASQRRLLARLREAFGKKA